MATQAHSTVLARVMVSDQDLQKCLMFDRESTVWAAKQEVLNRLAQSLNDAINYGLYLPPENGRKGKFLLEERLIGDYALKGPVAQLEFRYKRRVYGGGRAPDGKAMSKLHTRANLRKFVDLASKGSAAAGGRVAELLDKGVDPNFQDDDSGETPATIAAMSDDTEMITVLVEGGAHLDFRNRDGLTPLHKCAIHGKHRAVRALLDLGASPDLRDGDALTPLYQACVHGGPGSLRCVEMLLKDKAQLGVADAKLWTELHQAAKGGLDGHIEALGMYGADLTARNATGNTALHIASSWDQPAAATALAARGLDLELLNTAGQTAYQVATLAGATQVVEVLAGAVKAAPRALHEPAYVERSRTGSIRGRKTGMRGARVAEGTAKQIFAPPEVAADAAAAPAAALAPVGLTGRERSDSVTNNAPQATLERHHISLRKGPKGYGFRLQGSRQTPSDQTAKGQVVSSCDPNGASYAAGLRVGDRCIAVNGVDVMYANHQRVVDLIRHGRDSLELLVGRKPAQHRDQQRPNRDGKGSAGRSPLASSAAPTLPAAPRSPDASDRGSGHAQPPAPPAEDYPSLPSSGSASPIQFLAPATQAPAPGPGTSADEAPALVLVPPPVLPPVPAPTPAPASASTTSASTPAPPVPSAGSPLASLLDGIGKVSLRKTAGPVPSTPENVGRVVSEVAPGPPADAATAASSAPVATPAGGMLADILKIKLSPGAPATAASANPAPAGGMLADILKVKLKRVPDEGKQTRESPGRLKATTLGDPSQPQEPPPPPPPPPGTPGAVRLFGGAASAKVLAGSCAGDGESSTDPDEEGLAGSCSALHRAAASPLAAAAARKGARATPTKPKPNAPVPGARRPSLAVLSVSNPRADLPPTAARRPQSSAEARPRPTATSPASGKPVPVARPRSMAPPRPRPCPARRRSSPSSAVASMPVTAAAQPRDAAAVPSSVRAPSPLSPTNEASESVTSDLLPPPPSFDFVPPPPDFDSGGTAVLDPIDLPMIPPPPGVAMPLELDGLALPPPPEFGEMPPSAPAAEQSVAAGSGGGTRGTSSSPPTSPLAPFEGTGESWIASTATSIDLDELYNTGGSAAAAAAPSPSGSGQQRRPLSVLTGRSGGAAAAEPAALTVQRRVASALQPPKRMAIGAFLFKATNEDELSFGPGDRIELLETPQTGGWWRGSFKGMEGWFPSNHARELVASPAKSRLVSPTPAPSTDIANEAQVAAATVGSHPLQWDGEQCVEWLVLAGLPEDLFAQWSAGMNGEALFALRRPQLLDLGGLQLMKAIDALRLYAEELDE